MVLLLVVIQEPGLCQPTTQYNKIVKLTEEPVLRLPLKIKFVMTEGQTRIVCKDPLSNTDIIYRYSIDHTFRTIYRTTREHGAYVEW